MFMQRVLITLDFLRKTSQILNFSFSLLLLDKGVPLLVPARQIGYLNISF